MTSNAIDLRFALAVAVIALIDGFVIGGMIYGSVAVRIVTIIVALPMIPINYILISVILSNETK